MATTLEPALGRQRSEQEWLTRLRQAEAAWLAACRDYKLACESEGEVDSAYTAKVGALVEYKRVLRIFTDLVVARKTPQENT